MRDTQSVCEKIDCINRESQNYEHQNEYHAVPGPNSNTYVSKIANRCGVDVSLPPGAFGQNYDVGEGGLGGDGIGIDVGVGVNNGDLYLGAALGGVEVGRRQIGANILGFNLGIGFDRPRINLLFFEIPLWPQ